MPDIHVKLAKVASEIGPLNKTERNSQQGFNFRSIEALTGAVRPLFGKHEISVAPRLRSMTSEPVESGKGSKGYRTLVEMEYEFTAGSDGSSIVVSMPGEAVDYGDKSTSKAVQMAFKYALTEVLLVGSGDADHDGVNPEESKPSRRRPRRAPDGVDAETGEVAAPPAPQAVAAYVASVVQGFSSWSEEKRRESYVRQAKHVLGDGVKAETRAQADQVLKAMEEEYLAQYPDEKPF